MQLGRIAGAVVLCVAVTAGLPAGDAWAHAGIVLSDPLAGATLGASPTAVTLSFSEQPQASLSEIRVLDARGTDLGRRRAEPVSGKPLSLIAPVPRLARGVYTVRWRVVSAVDGHASAGAYAFGVGVSPKDAAVVVPTIKASTSGLEVVARWILLVGLVVLLGAGVAAAARFGGSTGAELPLGAAGWLLSVAGLVLLMVAQRSAADSSLSDLLDTPVGEALVWRAVAIGAAGAALLLARRRPRVRRVALAGAAVAALAAIAVHVAAGHAAAGTWPKAVTVLAQVAHFAAAGVWFGGLAALLLGVRGAPSPAKAAAVRRFSGVALVAVIVVAVTGTVRSVDELSSWGELLSSGYGRAVLAKVALLMLIVGLAARNRRRSVPAAATDLRPLRRTSRLELVLAAGALATAALLGSLAPPVAGQPSAPTGITASGADFGTTVRVRLTAASAEPGPNSFVVRVEDYDSKAPVRADRVRLRFTPIDDPDVDPTPLALKRGADGSYAGSGPNLEFDGRWGVAVLIERARDAVEVPLTLDVRGPTHFVSTLRVPGRAPDYTMELQGLGYVRIRPDPERAGPSKLTVYVLDVFEAQTPVRQIVLTTKAGDGPARQHPLRRLGPGLFEGDVALEKGPYEVAVVAKTSFGLRLRAPFELDIPGA
jgi:copper transport protein